MASLDSPGVRMRKRAFLNEHRRLKKRQGGVTPKHDAILEGVYELEPKPDRRTEARLANQLDLDPIAVKTWFRNRRVKDKRANARSTGTVFLFLAFVVLACVYLWELNGLDAVMAARRESAPANKRHMTKSGLPRPYGVKGPFEKQFARPSKEYREPTPGDGGGARSSSSGESSGTAKKTSASSGRLGSYFSSVSSSGKTEGRVRKAESGDGRWDAET